MKSLILTALTLAYTCAPVAAATVKCGRTSLITGIVKLQFGEARQTRGLDEKGNLFEIWANTYTGTWTLITISPKGKACFVTAGRHYDYMGIPLGKPV